MSRSGSRIASDGGGDAVPIFQSPAAAIQALPNELRSDRQVVDALTIAASEWTQRLLTPGQLAQIERGGIPFFVDLGDEHERLACHGQINADLMHRLSAAIGAARAIKATVLVDLPSSGTDADWTLIADQPRDAQFDFAISVDQRGDPVGKVRALCGGSMLESIWFNVSELTVVTHHLTANVGSPEPLVGSEFMEGNSMVDFAGTDRYMHLVALVNAVNRKAHGPGADGPEAATYVPVWKLQSEESPLSICNGAVLLAGDLSNAFDFELISDSSPITESKFWAPLLHRALVQKAAAAAGQVRGPAIADVIASSGRSPVRNQGHATLMERPERTSLRPRL